MEIAPIGAVINIANTLMANTSDAYGIKLMSRLRAISNAIGPIAACLNKISKNIKIC